MSALYVETDKFAAAWLRELIAWDLIADGDVYEGSFEDLNPEYLGRYVQVHLCAGIGVWSYALRQAGWPDDRPVWTASFPCQPFSAAGQGKGFTDERHLWPTGHWLIDQCRPVTLFGEQVASKPGLEWFDLVSSDLEGSGYTVGAHDLCAAGVGAPHIRQRLYFVAHADGRDTGAERQQRSGQHRQQPEDGRSGGGLQHAESDGRIEQGTEPERRRTFGFWGGADWIPCRDGKWRPVEPGTFPLAHGAPVRVGRLRGYGNALVAPVAEAFIKAVMACL